VVVDREIEAARRALERFAALYGCERAPVPVEDVADSLCGLRVVEVDGIAESGMLLPQLREVRVNARECAQAPRRRRFTVAHEIGHWLLHAQGAVPRTVWCRITDGSEPGDALEREANRFAAELLMPEAWVRDEAARSGADREALAQRFDVSEIAMGWRLFNLGLAVERPDQSETPNSRSTSASSASSA
jgi:Zn-dependent peptidase ImmA (M78 family)